VIIVWHRVYYFVFLLRRLYHLELIFVYVDYSSYMPIVYWCYFNMYDFHYIECISFALYFCECIDLSTVPSRLMALVLFVFVYVSRISFFYFICV